MLDAFGQLALPSAGQAIGLGVFERAGVLFAQANGLAEPEALERRRGGGVCHAASRRSDQGVRITPDPPRRDSVLLTQTHGDIRLVDEQAVDAGGDKGAQFRLDEAGAGQSAAKRILQHGYLVARGEAQACTGTR